MTRILLGAALAAVVACGAAWGAPLRAEMSLNSTWQAVQTRADGDAPPERGWERFEVPGTVYGPATGESRYLWLRRDVAIPSDWRDRRVFLRLLGARYDPHVYVDGRLIGHRLDGYTPFEVELTDAVQAGRTHRIEVRCQDVAAVFASLPHLPEEGWDAPEVKGQLLAPVSGHWDYFGPWDEIYLIARPKTHLTRHVVIPSVREGTLTVTGELSGPDRELRVDGTVLEDDRPVLDLSPVRVNGDGQWRLRESFPNAHPWSPEDPHLYTLRLTLRTTRDGPAVDAVEQPMGFKEFWIEGPDFYLNGVKRHLLATSTWPPSAPENGDFLRRSFDYWKRANCVAFRQHTQPWRKDWIEMADRVGMMMVVEAAMWTDSGRYAYEDERFWRNYRDHLERMVWRDRNNPCLVMWSLENEFLSVGNDRYYPQLESRLAELGRFVQSVDPHHPITYESDLDPGGVADVIGLHYPHELPEFTAYPNTADWLERAARPSAQAAGAGKKAQFVWRRRKPLYIGEYLWIFPLDYSAGTALFGDRAYLDRVKYKNLAKAEAWFYQTVAYRRAGVSGMCPWTIGLPGRERPGFDALVRAQREAYRPVAAFLRERDSRFFSGERVRRTFDVFNDSPREQRLELRWKLGDDARGAETVTLPPAGYHEVEVQVPLPDVHAAEERAFENVLLTAGKPVHTETRSYTIEPKQPISVPAGVRVLLYDPAAAWTPGFDSERIRSLSDLADAEPREVILVIAPGALPAPREPSGTPIIGNAPEESEHLAAFLNRGGRMLVLAQQSLSSLPLPVSLTPHASTMTFSLASSHPLLAGIGADDLKFWRGDHHVSRYEISRPTSAGARTLVVSGGSEELNQGPVVEIRSAGGVALLVQALVAEKADREPVARKLLGNAFAYLAAERPARTETVLVSDDASFADALRTIGVAFRRISPDAAPDRSALLMAHGAATSAAVLRKHLNAGGTVYWHAPEPQAFGAVAEEIGMEALHVTPARGPVSIFRPDHPLLAGVSREDLHFIGPRLNWRGETNVDPTVIDRVVLPRAPEADTQAVEAEKMRFEGQIVGRSAGGSRIHFATTGRAFAQTQVKQAGLYSVSIRAGGSPAAGVYPIVALRADGRKVGTISIMTREVREYTALAELPAGDVELSVEFTNDAVVGAEDRNLWLESLAIASEPWRTGDLEVLTLPSALVSIPVREGRLVVDCVRWDTNMRNLSRGRRYACALLTNLGASFEPVRPDPTWLSTAVFEPVGRVPHFSRTEHEVTLVTSSTVRGMFRCARAGTYAVFVRARSSEAFGEYAKVAVEVDGTRVGEVETRSSTTGRFRVGTVHLSEGEHRVSASFTNDVYRNGQDRNLWFQSVGFRHEP